MTIDETIEILTKLHDTAKTIEYIDNPVVWALQQTLNISTKETQVKNNDNYNIVQNWKRQHIQGKKIDCARDTGLSRPTIDKYWEVEE